MKSGIYCIRNTLTDQLYVGSACDFKKRWKSHRSQLNLGKHENDYLQRAWKKYGSDAFAFSILEAVENIAQLVEREQFWFGALPCHISRGGYNISPTAENCLGVKHTAETKAKLSKARKGVPKSAEHKRGISDANKGKIRSAEQRRKMSEASKQTFQNNPELRRMASDRLRGKAPHNLGKPMSEAQRGALVDYAKHRAQTDAGRANLARIGLLAKTIDARRKLSESKRGKKASDEAKAKMSLSQTLRWQGASQEERQSHASGRIGKKFVYKTSPTPEHVAAMVRLREGGLSFRELSEQFGFSEECVRKNLIKYFGEDATRNPVRDRKVQDIIRMHDLEGMTFDAIGAHFGNSGTAMHKAYHKYRNK